MIILCGACSILFSLNTVSAQEKTDNKVKDSISLEEDLPLMFKFEPEYFSKNKARKEEIAITRSMIDTLNVSDRKRQKLLKELYKNGSSKRLQKALMTHTAFEEDQ